MRHRLKLLVAAGTVVVLSALAAGTADILSRGARAFRLVAETKVEANGQALENALNRQLLQVDAALASLPALFQGLSNGSSSVSPAAAGEVLSAVNFQAFSFRDILLVAPDETVWASALPRSSATAHAALSEELRRSRAIADSTLTGPVRNPLTGDWVLFRSRRVAIAGVGNVLAVAEIALPTLVGQMAEARLDHQVRVALERRDGTLIASLPHDEVAIGKRRVPAVSTIAQSEDAFTLRQVGGDMFAVVRHSLISDLFIAVTYDETLALAEWTQERSRILGISGAAACLVLGLAAALFLALRQRDKLELERARSAKILDAAIEAMSDGFVMWDEEDRLLACNQAYRDMYALSAPFLTVGTPFEEIIRKGAEAGQYPTAVGRIEAFVQDLLAWRSDRTGSMERLLPDGRWCLITERAMPEGGTVGIRTDITALKAALADLAVANERANEAVAVAQEHNRQLKERDVALHSQNALFEAALNTMSHGLLMVDGEDRLIVGNRHYSELFGLDPAAVKPGIGTSDLYAAIAARGPLDASMIAAISSRHAELAAARGSGGFVSDTARGRSIAVTQRPLAEGGWVAVYEDVTSQRQAEGRVRFLAHHDDLTKLPNRVHFRDEVDRRLHGSGEAFALLYLDLDRFKDVNDTFGHPTGDALLKDVAQRLVDAVPATDTVARLGGDEFAVIHPLGNSVADPELLSERIISVLSRPYDVLGRAITIGATVGIAIVTDVSETDADTVIKNADLALYQAKALQRGTVCLFKPELEERRRVRLRLESDLREAIENQAFTLAYQPIYDVHEERVTSFEALVRWHHPERGWISPGDFIPVAEDAGLIADIGAWVLRQACHDVAQLPGNPNVAVNLSTQQLVTDEIVSITLDALRTSGLAPERLHLEITETALLTEYGDTTELLRRLRDLGPELVLDDFGTGYSSLSHLRSFPLSKVKIDQSFVREMMTNRGSAAIVTSVASLARCLGMRTTAEGVETVEQLNLVRLAGCSEAQGYLLGRPASILHGVDAMRSSLSERLIATQRLSA